MTGYLLREEMKYLTIKGEKIKREGEKWNKWTAIYGEYVVTYNCAQVFVYVCFLFS